MAKGTCSVEGCQKPAAKARLCWKHYERKRKYGDVHFVTRHFNSFGTLEERLERNTDRTGECWVWLGHVVAGYGVIRVNGVRMKAHRASYEHYVGSVPEGLTMDHLCRNKRCVNPAHLEPVTQAENNRRKGIAYREARTHCPHGHEWTPENTRPLPNGRRECRICRRLTSQRHYWRNKAA